MNASIQCTIVIDPSLMCGNPPVGQVDVMYSHALPNTSSSTFTVSLTGGELPPGLSLSSVGMITGLPTIPGTYSFQATIVSDGLSSVADCSIQITGASPFKNFAY